MDSDAEMMARHGRMLAELAKKAHAVACELADRTLAAEDAAEKAQLGRAFHEVSRSVRQCLALELRLRREARRLARDEADESAARHGRALAARKGEAHAALHDLVWNEYELTDALNANALVGRMIDEAAEGEAFLTQPLEAVVQRLSRRIEAAIAPYRDEADEDAAPAEAEPPDAGTLAERAAQAREIAEEAARAARPAPAPWRSSA